MKHYLNISCKESSFLISKRQETKITIPERIKLFFHLRICNTCKLFKKQTDLILSVLSKEKNTDTVDNKLSEEAKNRMSKNLAANMKSNS